MPYEFYNPSPTGARIGDCVIRAICKALDQTWEHTYVALCVQGFSMCDLPNADSVWGEYLRSQGFQRYIIPNTCPDCYNIRDFASDHPSGTYVLGTGSHAVTVQDGTIYDSWNSGNEIPIFYYAKMEENYSEARDGRSNRMGRSYDRSYDGRSYDDMSMARNRDSMGRCSRDEFMDKLTMMRESAPNEKSRRAIDKMIDELEN